MSRASITALGMAIEARKLGKSYGANWAVHGVDLDVAPGEAVALFGANATGKSTLVRLLAGLTPPSAGTIRLMGHDIARPARAVRQATGILGHQSYLYAELTATENLELYARLYGLDMIRDRVTAALEAVGLTQASTKRVRELSRGMQQRLALARATLHSPAVLLLDEPDSGLDAGGTLLLERIVVEGRERGQAVVLATHQIGLGLRVCARALILARGKIAYDAPVTAHQVDEWHTLYHEISTRGL